jgi:hypothetical protein
VPGLPGNWKPGSTVRRSKNISAGVSDALITIAAAKQLLKAEKQRAGETVADIPRQLGDRGALFLG